MSDTKEFLPVNQNDSEALRVVKRIINWVRGNEDQEITDLVYLYDLNISEEKTTKSSVIGGEPIVDIGYLFNKMYSLFPKNVSLVKENHTSEIILTVIKKYYTRSLMLANDNHFLTDKSHVFKWNNAKESVLGWLKHSVKYATDWINHQLLWNETNNDGSPGQDYFDTPHDWVLVKYREQDTGFENPLPHIAEWIRSSKKWSFMNAETADDSRYNYYKDVLVTCWKDIE